MQYTIDILIAELNEVAKRPSAEYLRISTIINVRHVFTKIGISLLAEVKDEEIQVSQNRYRLPERTVQVLDVGREKTNYQGINISRGLANNRELVYSVTPMEIYFPNYPNGKVWVQSYQFYLDEAGSIIIPEMAYKACFDYCHWQIAYKNPVSPIYQDRWMLKRQAEESIFAARGDMNETTPGKYRGFRKTM